MRRKGTNSVESQFGCNPDFDSIKLNEKYRHVEADVVKEDPGKI
jgi:hypothetical protein